MRPDGPRSCFLVLVTLAAIASCDEPTDPARAGGDEAEAFDGDPAAAQSKVPVYYLRPVTIERTSGTQTVQIPLDGRPWLDFMGPFDLFVVKSDSIRGRIELDGVNVRTLNGILPGDTVSRRLTNLGAASTIEVRLTGRARGTVTVWIMGRLQPKPIITLETPLRGAMLDTGVTSLTTIPVRGRACHPRYPITSLKIFSIALPVSGDSLCESFSTTVSSPFGMTLISMEATNARGRTGRLVQSFMRADLWAAADVATGAIPNAFNSGGVWLRQPALDDANSITLNDFNSAMRAMTPSLDTHFPDVIYDGEPTQPPCLGLPVTRRGYVITKNGAVDHGVVTSAVTLVNGGAGDVLRYAPITVRFRVYGHVKRACETPTVGTSNGVVTISFAQASHTMDVVLNGGELRSFERANSSSVSLGTATISLTPGRNSGLNATQQAEILEFLPTMVRELTRSAVRTLSMHRTTLFDGMLRGMDAIAPPALDSLGVHVDTRPQYMTATTSRINVIWSSNIEIDRVRRGNAPALGPVMLGQAVNPANPGAVLGAVGLDLMNPVLWAAWRGGRFDLTDLFDHPLAPATEGISARLHSILPPAIQFAPISQHFRIGWGDLRLDVTVDPSVHGDAPPGTPPITGRAFAAMYVDVQLHYDEVSRALAYTIQPLHSGVVVQLPDFPGVWIDETAVEQALVDAIWSVAPPMVGRVLAALPLPASIPFTLDGQPQELRLVSDSESGIVSHLVLAGRLVLE